MILYLFIYNSRNVILKTIHKVGIMKELLLIGFLCSLSTKNDNHIILEIVLYMNKFGSLKYGNAFDAGKQTEEKWITSIMQILNSIYTRI